MIRISKVRIPGLPTEEPRRLYVYLPRDYETSGLDYPVLYMFDGHNVFYDSHATYGKSWGMKEYLTRTKLPLIVAAVECNHEGNRRLNEYAPWDVDVRGLGHLEGLGKRTMDWMAGPLKQFIDGAYRTLPGRENTVIAGSSMGGLMALYAVVSRNDVYSCAAALSPSLWAGGKQLQALLSEAKLQSPTRIYMDVGSGEVPPRGHARLTEMFTAAGKLTRAGADAAALVIPGALHNEAAWEKRIPLFMHYLLSEDGTSMLRP